MNISFRDATSDDALLIAHIHAKSWQTHYRGICTDQYLDHEVVEDRSKVWVERFASANANQHVLLAFGEESQVVGFVCTFLDYHMEYGAYLDNLHVVTEYQGNRIGKALMRESALWVASKDLTSTLYLHVLDENKAAIAFYERIGGKLINRYEMETPWGKRDMIRDYIWDLDQLI